MISVVDDFFTDLINFLVGLSRLKDMSPSYLEQVFIQYCQFRMNAFTKPCATTRRNPEIKLIHIVIKE